MIEEVFGDPAPVISEERPGEQSADRPGFVPRSLLLSRQSEAKIVLTAIASQAVQIVPCVFALERR